MRDTFSEKVVKDRGEAINKQFKELLDCLRVMPKAKPEEKKQRLEWMKSRPEYDTFEMEVINVWNNGSASIKEAQVDLTVLKKSIQLAIEKYTGISKKGKEYTFFQSVEQIYRQENFEVQFKDFFDCLRIMPKGKTRLEWMKNRPESDALKIEVIKVWNPESYDRLTRVQNERYISTTFDSDDGIETTIKTEKTGRRDDPEVIMETFNKCIEDFTGVKESGEPYTFLQSMGQKYKQNAGKHAGANDFQKTGFSINYKDADKLSQVFKFVRKVDKYCRNTNQNSIELIEKFISKSVNVEEFFPEIKKEDCTKTILELAKWCMEMNFAQSMDALISEEYGNGITVKDQIESIEKGFEDIEQMEWLNSFESNFEAKWNLAVSAMDKKNLEFFKNFLSRDILVALKLEAVNEAEREKYKDLLEPKCASWCSAKDKCPYVTYEDGKKTTSRNSCFIRYGERTIANGNEDVYELLKRIGDSFYKYVLANPYVKNAYIENVDNIDDLYCVKLKPRISDTEGGSFLFTDAVIASAMGKGEGKVSQARKEYEKRRALFSQVFKCVLHEDDELMPEADMKKEKRCAFCKYWDDSTIDAILRKNIEDDLCEIDPIHKNKCLLNNYDMKANAFCNKYERKAIVSRGEKKCVFCKNWNDPTINSIIYMNSGNDLCEIDVKYKNKCLLENYDKCANEFCDKHKHKQIVSREEKKCVFCKYWDDPTNCAILNVNPENNLCEIDIKTRNKCLLKNKDMKANESCAKFEISEQKMKDWRKLFDGVIENEI